MVNEKKVLPEESILVIGNNNTGKTSLINSLNGDNFDAIEERTLGINITNYRNDVCKTKIVDFTIVDKDILEELKKIKPTICLITETTRNSNYKASAERWLSLLNEANINESCTKILVLTKTDIQPYNIDESKLKSEIGVNDVYAVSIKEGIGIQELRNNINTKIKENQGFEEESEVAKVINKMIVELCELVARNPEFLKEIEWRNMERIIAKSLEVIGFKITLTEPSKDGGKDIIANCYLQSKEKTYYLEIKHWNEKSKVGTKDITSFIEVNILDRTDGGLFLSSSGFTKSVHSSISEIKKQNIRIANKNKIVTLCKKMVRVREGLYLPSTILPEVLFEETIDDNKTCA